MPLSAWLAIWSSRILELARAVKVYALHFTHLQGALQDDIKVRHWDGEVIIGHGRAVDTVSPEHGVILGRYFRVLQGARMHELSDEEVVRYGG